MSNLTIPLRKVAMATLLSCASLMAHAADNPSATAQAIVTNLHYHLEDLAPDDGQAPSLTVGHSSLYLSASDGLQNQHSTVPLAPLPTGQVVVNGPPGTYAQASPDTLVAKMSANVSRQLTSVQNVSLNRDGGTLLETPSAGLYVSELFNSESPEGPQPEGLTLSAYSKLVIQGSAQVSSYAKATAVLGQSGQALDMPYEHKVSSTGTVSLQFQQGDIFESRQVASWVGVSKSTATYTWDGVAHEGPAANDSQSLPILLELTNDSDHPLNVYFNWHVSATSFETVNAISAVPEPESNALALVGAMFVGTVLRSRKAKVQGTSPVRSA